MFGNFGMLALAALYTLASISDAHAQAEPQKPTAAADAEAIIASEEYKGIVREGMLKYTRGLWDEAREYFLKAHGLAPNARTLRGLALVGYDSRHFVQAIDYAQQSLAHTVQPLTDKMREELQKLIGESQSKVARADLITTPADAELRVDGALVTRHADGTLWVDPGTRELSVSAPGHLVETRRLELSEQQQVRLEITLASRTAAEPAHIATAAPKPRAPEPSPLPWVVAGVSAGVAAVGGVMLVLDQTRSEGSTTALTPVGATLLGVGAVGTIVGLTWSLWPRESERATTAHLHLSPLSIQCSGTF